MVTPVKIWRNQKNTQKILGLAGVIVTYTQIYAPPTGFSLEAPYTVVVVTLTNGLHLTAQLVDFNEYDLNIGKKVQAVLRRTSDMGEDGVISYGIKFKPIN